MLRHSQLQVASHPPSQRAVKVPLVLEALVALVVAPLALLIVAAGVLPPSHQSLRLGPSHG